MCVCVCVRVCVCVCLTGINLSHSTTGILFHFSQNDPRLQREEVRFCSFDNDNWNWVSWFLVKVLVTGVAKTGLSFDRICVTSLTLFDTNVELSQWKCRNDESLICRYLLVQHWSCTWKKADWVVFALQSLHYCISSALVNVVSTSMVLMSRVISNCCKYCKKKKS